MHAGAGRPEVDENQAKDKADGRHHLKIDQGLDRNAADLFCFPDVRNSMHDGAENDRRYEHAHELDKQIAQRLQRVGALR